MIANIFSYSPQDFILFSQEAFQSVIRRYNNDIGIWSIAIFFLNILLFFYFKKRKTFSVLYLAIIWAFIGIVFHWRYFLNINWAARWLGWIFISQSILYCGLHRFSRPNSSTKKTSLPFLIGFLLLWFSILFPWSFFFSLSQGEVLLMGWGPTATAIGSFGFNLMNFQTKTMLLLSIIPLFWIFLFATLYSYLV